jgi:hypothetical protein
MDVIKLYFKLRISDRFDLMVDFGVDSSLYFMFESYFLA